MTTRPDPLSSTSPFQQQHSGDDERPAKRHKIAAACDQCREKKIKCDGERPTCSPCQKRFGSGARCEWGERKTRSIGASKLEIIRLQSRIDELERVNRRKSLLDGGEQPRTSSVTPMSAEDQNDQCGANAMMGLIEGGERAEESAVGDSSAASFMKRIKAVLDHQLNRGPASQPPQSTTPSSVTAGLVRQRRFRNPDYVLPSRHQADKFLEIYWRLVDPLYPFVDKDDFLDKYQSLWTGNPNMDDEVCFICLLNALFAVTCLLDSSIRPQDRVSSGEVYYKRAQGYVDLDLLQFQHIHTVQCLLFLAQYLQSTREPQQCWLFVGLAIRIAQGLGLDLASASPSSQVTDKISNGLLRKVWHSCVLMDRILSMTLGRPAVITPQAAASVPRPVPHAQLADCNCHKELCEFNPSSPDLHFFIETLKLYEITSETLSALYDSPSWRSDSQTPAANDSYAAYFGADGARAAGMVLEIDSKYTSWQQSLPIHLCHDESVNQRQNMIHARQATVLWLRYAHSRTLLFRPVLSQFSSVCHDSSSPLETDTLAYKLALQCSVICAHSALRTITIFSKIHASVRLDLMDEWLPAWWYCILYLYTAATVLVAARLNATIVTELGGEEVVLEASRNVTQCLARYAAFGKHAGRCAAAVGLLFEQLSRQGLQTRKERDSSNIGIKTNTPQPSGFVNGQGWGYNHQGLAAGSVAVTDKSTGLPNEPTLGYATTNRQALAPSSIDDPFFDPTDMRFDLDLGGDMSWLSSIPFELYSENI